MSVENLQYKINDRLEKRIATLEKNIISLAYPKKDNELKITNKILTSLLVVLYSQSSLTSKTKKELSPHVSRIVEDINLINPLINDWNITNLLEHTNWTTSNYTW